MVSAPPAKPDASERLDALRELLLHPDRMEQSALRARLQELEALLRDEPAFARLLEPHLMRQLAELQENFPALFGKSLATAIKVQIRDAQAEIIDALYPIIGKLIARYLRAELERISQQIDQRLKDPFSWESLKLRIKARLTGVPYEELLFREGLALRVEAVFLIEKETGLPLAHCSRAGLAQPEVVAGMLTGIKSFIEHAFQTESQELETLVYERYTISLHNFETYYAAVALSGPPDAAFRQRLRDHVLRFSESAPVHTGEPVTRDRQDALSAALEAHFTSFA